MNAPNPVKVPTPTERAGQFRVTWKDRGREPRCAPDPKYPHGIILDTSSDGAAETCSVEVPYPAKRCGVYTIRCKKCGIRMACTTAGRPDDPRVVKIGCHEQKFHAPGTTQIVTHPKKEPHP